MSLFQRKDSELSKTLDDVTDVTPWGGLNEAFRVLIMLALLIGIGYCATVYVFAPVLDFITSIIDFIQGLVESDPEPVVAAEAAPAVTTDVPPVDDTGAAPGN